MDFPVSGRKAFLLSALCFLIAVMAAGRVRFEQIALKPLHHDEGVNSYFLLNLARDGRYQYDPTNYHGPTLYYFSLVATRVFGENEIALRFWPAAFGLLAVVMVWLARRHLGPVGTPVAAMLMALSPGLVYFSRDFIHEMMFGCFSLGIVMGAVQFTVSRKFRWVALSAVSAGLLFATKETAMISAAVLILATICALLWDGSLRLWREKRFSAGALARGVWSELCGRWPSLDFTLAALIIFLFINIFFYSSLFRHWQGVADAVTSLQLWTQRSGSEHVKGFWYYGGILLKLELPLLVGSIVAGGLIVRRATKFWLFVAAWALGLFLAYSLIGYKTPWLIVSLLLPMALLGGHAAQRVIDLFAGHRWLRTMSLLLIGLALILNSRLTNELNLELYDDNQNRAGYFPALGLKLNLKPYLDGQYGYAYVQTDRGIMTLLQLIEEEAARLAEGKETGIFVSSPDYWPLPWYLRDYPRVAYSGTLPAFQEDGSVTITQPLIIANANQMGAYARLPGYRVSPTSYPLRPGADLVLLVRDQEITKPTESEKRK